MVASSWSTKLTKPPEEAENQTRPQAKDLRPRGLVVRSAASRLAVRWAYAKYRRLRLLCRLSGRRQR